MRIKLAGKLAILIVVAGAAYGGYNLWKSHGINLPFIGKGDGHTIGGDQGILGRPLRVAVDTWPGFGGGFAANGSHFKPNRESIFWQKHNLLVDFVLMDDPDAMNKAWATGDIDVIWSTTDSFSNSAPGFVKGGVNPRAIMQVDWSRGGDAIVADQSIQRVEDLKGKHIALTPQTPSHWLLVSSLQNSSLDDTDQDAILKRMVGTNGSPDAEKVFAAGKVDAFVGWEPDISHSLRDRANSHILVSTRTAANLISDIVVVDQKFADNHQDVLKAFVQGWMEGTELANRNPQTVVDALIENEPTYTSLGATATQDTLDTVHYATLADNAKSFGLDGSEPLFNRIFKTSGQAWVRLGIITSTVDPNSVIDTRFIKAAYQAEPQGQRSVTPTNEFKFKPPTSAIAHKGAVMTKPVKIHFASNSSALSEEAKSMLDNVATLLQTYSNAYIRVEGNSASTGHAAGEVKLSKLRAESVVRYLVTRYGFDRNRFVAVGNGPYKPVAPNNTEAGQALNRRTDIKVVPK